MTAVLADIAVGSNLGPRSETVERAVALLRAHPDVEVLAVSSWHETPPMGPGQPHFVNGVVRLSTALTPVALLGLLQAIERRIGRRPHRRRWGPRVLDLDLVDYDGRARQTRRLVLPHPGAHVRPFVVEPRNELP